MGASKMHDAICGTWGYINCTSGVACLIDMVRQKCTVSLKRYGFCGILAIVYALDLPMPKNRKDLMEMFGSMKAILGMSSDTWCSAMPKKQGALSYESMVQILEHYKCKFEVMGLGVNKNNKTVTLNKWLKGVDANACYIVVVRKHAVFIETPRIKSKWRLYDQGGVQTKKDMSRLTMKKGYGARHVQHVIKIM